MSAPPASAALPRRTASSKPATARLSVRAITMKSGLRRAAEALDCALVYSFVPKGSFEEVLQTRARRIAAEIIGKVDHTMRLEAQNLQSDKLNEEIENLAAQILREQHKIIWDKR